MSNEYLIFRQMSKSFTIYVLKIFDEYGKAL